MYSVANQTWDVGGDGFGEGKKEERRGAEGMGEKEEAGKLKVKYLIYAAINT